MNSSLGTQWIEINIADKRGILIASSYPEFVGFNYSSSTESSGFLVLLDGSTLTYSQPMREDVMDDTRYVKYSGRRFEDGSGFLQVGLPDRMYDNWIEIQGQYVATNRSIGDTGYLMVCSADHKIINSYHNEHKGQNIADSGIELDPDADNDYTCFKCDVFGVPSYVTVNDVGRMHVLGVYPEKEANYVRDEAVTMMVIMESAVFGILFVGLIVLMKKVIVNNIVKVNTDLKAITGGNLDRKVEVRGTYEFDSLSTDINAMVDSLKEFITLAAARIDEELEVAKAIQNSVLPNTFPAFPDRDEFELYASMHAAKEVGGDFYDYYMIDDHTLGFLIADVSGKSIPGAMFMMTSKAVIKNLVESGLPVEEVFTQANKRLCEGNDAEMFLTAWLGFLDLETGLVRVANAGHNPPILIRDGKAEYLVLKPGLMLAGMEGMEYKEQTLQLQKGDILYLYTDGVTEAMDKEENLYGEERLKKALSFGEDYPEPSSDCGLPRSICELVTGDLVEFVQGAEQSDDITMLCIRYLGSHSLTDHHLKEITLEAIPDNVDRAVDFVDEILDEYGCGVKEKSAIDVAVDELFGNIANYAYGSGTGYATVMVNVVKEPLTMEITFIDSGIPYDPLAKEDPDVSQSLDERPIGGMGIFIVKKSMDAVVYEYKDGRNILTIKKKL